MPRKDQRDKKRIKAKSKNGKKIKQKPIAGVISAITPEETRRRHAQP